MPLNISINHQVDNQQIVDYFQDIADVITATEAIAPADADEVNQLSFELMTQLSHFVVEPNTNQADIKYLDIDIFTPKYPQDTISFHIMPTKLNVREADLPKVRKIISKFKQTKLPMTVHQTHDYESPNQSNTAFKEATISCLRPDWIIDIPEFFKLVSQPAVINELITTNATEISEYPITFKALIDFGNADADESTIQALSKFIDIISHSTRF